MIELLLLMAIGYAGARGVEHLAGTSDRRHDDAVHHSTVRKIAADPAHRKPVTRPGPVEEGGTFSAAAPRSALFGGKAAVPLAVLTETGATMWRAAGEGYRERWPQIRAERREKMKERAARKEKEKAEALARRQAAEARAKAGPPPAHPPQPSDPPDAAAEGEAEKTKPAPAPVPGLLEAEAEVRVAEAERRAAKAEAGEKEARREAEEARDRAARDKVLAAERTAREAREREAAAEDRARAAEKKAAAADADDAPAAKPATPAPAPAPAARAAASPGAPSPQTVSEGGGASPGRHLTVVPDTAQPEGDTMTPMTVIPEIRTLDGLMNALTIVKAMCEMRSEEALAIADDDMALSNRLDQLEGELGEMEVDDKTLSEIAELRESIHTQSKEAATYSGAAKDAGDFAVAVANAAFKSHGGIAEAVQSSPIEKAASAGYYER
ncbi:hypothetical protein ACWIG4_27150 [Streptomyces sp. NPDC002248]